MSDVLTRYAALEAAAIAAHQQAPVDPNADPFAFDEVAGPHSRLVSAFAWHPLLRRELALPPLALLVMAWIAVAIFMSRAPLPQPWGDEAFTMEVIALPWNQMLARLAGDLHPPLYFALMKVAYLAGATDLGAIRLAGLLLAGLPLGLLPLIIHAWPRNYRLLGSMIALVLCIYPLGFYLVMARYYGLLATLVAYGVVCTGNGLESKDERQSPRWLAGGAVAFALAALTNYQVWMVWAIAVIAALRLAPITSRRQVLFINVVSATLAAGVTVATLGGLAQLRDAGTSPFTTGFVSLGAEVIARIGVVVLAFLDGELIPLWWPPLLLGVAVGIKYVLPRVAQSTLSRTAILALCVGLASAVAMVLLTATVLPVGLEFLPPRVLYCFPLMAIALGEWLLRRSVVLRWWLGLAALNLLMAFGGLNATSAAIAVAAPAPAAPFLHATYLTPAPAIVRVLREAGYDPAQHTLVVEDAGTLFALKHAGLPWINEVILMIVPPGPMAKDGLPSQFTLGATVWVITSARDLSPSDQRKDWERKLSQYYTLNEEWQFLHEDPLWLRAKRLLLRREVAPYKKSLRRYRVD